MHKCFKKFTVNEIKRVFVWVINVYRTVPKFLCKFCEYIIARQRGYCWDFGDMWYVMYWRINRYDESSSTWGYIDFCYVSEKKQRFSLGTKSTKSSPKLENLVWVEYNFA